MAQQIHLMNDRYIIKTVEVKEDSTLSSCVDTILDYIIEVLDEYPYDVSNPVTTNHGYIRQEVAYAKQNLPDNVPDMLRFNVGVFSMVHHWTA